MARPTLSMVVVALCLTTHATVVSAEKGVVPRSFYDAKKLSTTREACARAEVRLARVRTGFSETRFLEIMEMEVLAKRGKPVDARMDGYLALLSKRTSARLGKDRRALVFGYVDGDSEVATATVVLRDHRVEEVHFTETAVAEARPGDGGPAQEKSRSH